jgi:hydrogenase small subunit
MGCNETIGASLERAGVSRRDFIGMVSKVAVATPVGMMLGGRLDAAAFADEVMQAPRPSVAWLHFQDCTGCTESLLRTSQPDVADLILNVISLDYHETLMAAAGHQAEECLEDILANHWGEFVCVVEGSIPRRHGGVYMKLAGKPALDVLDEVGQGAAAVIAIGSCASWGGIPSAAPNPTDAVGVDALLPDTTPIVNIPGCPPNPYTLLGVVLQFVKGRHASGAG